MGIFLTPRTFGAANEEVAQTLEKFNVVGKAVFKALSNIEPAQEQGFLAKTAEVCVSCIFICLINKQNEA